MEKPLVSPAANDATGSSTQSDSPSSAPTVTRETEIYIVCYIPSRLFPAHWCIWVPNSPGLEDGQPASGTIIQAQGDPLNGFWHEFVRDHVLSEDERRPWFRSLGVVKIKEKSGVEGPTEKIETTARNNLEQIALLIPAPSPSLRPAGVGQVR